MDYKRIELNHKTPLKAGGIYEFVGPVSGEPESATKEGIQDYLRKATKIPDLDVLDWGRVSGDTWRVQVRIRKLPSANLAETAEQPAIAAPVVVWVVGIIVTALLAGYMVWKFKETELQLFEMVPEDQRGAVMAAKTISWTVVALGVLVLAYYLARKK